MKQLITVDYLDGYQYESGKLLFFPTAEGYVKYTVGLSNPFDYVFNYTDHLGNIRLSYGINPATGLLKKMEENNYYPFGLKHGSYNIEEIIIAPRPVGGPVAGKMGKFMVQKAEPFAGILELPTQEPTIVPNFYSGYNYKFQNKEWQDELSLNLYDFGGRLYDPASVRTTTHDPLAEKFYNLSPQSFLNNNPLRFTDPTGMAPDDWIKNNITGQIEWREEVTSAETTPKGYQYVGKEYNGISIKTYETTSTRNSAGLSIQVDYKGPETSNEVDFMQTIRTNKPAEGATSPYNDPAPPKGGTAEDNKPFYYTDSEKPSYSDKFGQDLIFTDSPRRPSASSETTNWSGELSITTSSNSVHSIKETLTYGFKIDGGKTTLNPIFIQPASNFQKTTLDNYNKTLNKK